jgi:hypothetical protein
LTPPPAIHVSPQEAPIGTKITVAGEGFAPNTGIYITFEDMVFFTPIFISETGEFNTTIFVPAVTSGNYTIKAVSPAALYLQGRQALADASFTVTAGLDTLFQTINDLKTALNQTQQTAQTTLDEALSATEAAQAAEAAADEAKTYALIAMIFTMIIAALSSIYFTTLYIQLRKPRQDQETK